MRTNQIKVNIIVPVFNEFEYILPFLQSLESQTMFDDSFYLCTVSLVDGNSTDGTSLLLEKWKDTVGDNIIVNIVKNDRRFVAPGLNFVIKQSCDDVIVRMDVHALYPSNYLDYLCNTLLGDTNLGNVGISVATIPNGTNLTAHAIAAVCSHRFGVGSSFRSIDSNEIKYVDTVPFGCWRRQVFEEIGYFDEDMIRNQDDEFNWRLGAKGYHIALLPGMSVKYYARKTLVTHNAMFYQYGVFKPLTILKSSAIKSFRPFFPLMFVVCVVTLVGLSAINAVFLLGIFAVVGSYFLMSLIIDNQSQIEFKRHSKIRRILMITVVLMSTHWSYGVGFAKGIVSVFKAERVKTMSQTR